GAGAAGGGAAGGCPQLGRASPRVRDAARREERDDSPAARATNRGPGRPRRRPVTGRGRAARPGADPPRGGTAGAERGAGTGTPPAAGGRAGANGADAADGSEHGPRAGGDGPAAQRPAAALRRDSPRTGAAGAQRRLAKQDRRTQEQTAGLHPPPRRRSLDDG